MVRRQCVDNQSPFPRHRFGSTQRLLKHLVDASPTSVDVSPTLGRQLVDICNRFNVAGSHQRRTSSTFSRHHSSCQGSLVLQMERSNPQWSSYRRCRSLRNGCLRLGIRSKWVLLAPISARNQACKSRAGLAAEYGRFHIWISRELVAPNFVDVRPLGGNFLATPMQWRGQHPRNND